MADGVESISHSWDRIESLLHVNVARLRLRDGASSQQLSHWELATDLVLPADLQASYRRHDGQELDGDDLIDDWSLLSIQDSVKVWAMLNEVHSVNSDLDEGTSGRPAWSCHWLPITTNGLGDHIVIDLSMPGGSQAARLIRFGHETIARPVVAESFGAWLQAVAEQLALQTIANGAPDREAQPTVEMADLLRLLGLPLSHKYVSELMSSEEIARERDGTEIVLHGVSAGFDVTSQKGLINQVDLYFSPSTGESRFRGKLIAGVEAGDSRTRIREKLGTPVACDQTSAVEVNVREGWDAYRIGELRVQFTFRPDWRGIAWITVRPAS